MLLVGSEVNFLHMIPPQQELFKTVGRCTADCTKNVSYWHDIYTVNGITTRTLRLDFTRNYNVLSFRHNVSQQYLMVCWLWRLGPYLNSTL